MLKSEKKKLLVEIKRVIGEKIVMLIANGWTAREIYEKAGVTQNRLSEFKNYKKYQRPISEKNLSLLIENGIIEVAEIMKKIQPDRGSEREKFLKNLRLFEYKSLYTEALKVIDEGLDPVEILKARNKKK